MTELVTQVLALVAFFAFPALQYVLLKRFSIREGRPELFYLPAYGFRLVVRNIPGKRSLSEIKYRALLREVVPAGDGASVATFHDTLLLQREDFFLFPGFDQVLVSFKLIGKESDLFFVHTDKLGAEISRFPIAPSVSLIADYSASLKNLLNFDVKLAKRAEVNAERLVEAFRAVKETPDQEQQFLPTRVRDVG